MDVSLEASSSEAIYNPVFCALAYKPCSLHAQTPSLDRTMIALLLVLLPSIVAQYAVPTSFGGCGGCPMPVCHPRPICPPPPLPLCPQPPPCPPQYASLRLMQH
ncbi:hypothetical protein ANCCEY_01539 [Ancylostoma ceylanicum]|uniref:Uncharacterized protein n=1 Tax=Ancylostoma ceylanicum TaxID=53326 RepID=A0A0D6M5J8_9BILA|nr:hypothetical protein ANCCEY_01539 [Ancylostoma ceylanicum]